MNHRTFTAVLLSLLLIGVTSCTDSGNSSGQTTGTSESEGSTASGDYLGGIAGAKQRAVKTIDLTALKQAVQMFNVSEGRNPKDLQELVTKQYIREIPEPPHGQKITYNATTGTVTITAE